MLGWNIACTVSGLRICRPSRVPPARSICIHRAMSAAVEANPPAAASTACGYEGIGWCRPSTSAWGAAMFPPAWSTAADGAVRASPSGSRRRCCTAASHVALVSRASTTPATKKPTLE